MKSKLFEDIDPNLSKEDREIAERVIIDTLEAENCGAETRTFVRSYTIEETQEAERDYIESAKKLSELQTELKTLSEPLKAEMKPIDQHLKSLVSDLKQGGQSVTEKVYLFPDPESRMMGLYDKTGTFVGSRPMSQQEKQFHINSFNQRAVS